MKYTQDSIYKEVKNIYEATKRDNLERQEIEKLREKAQQLVIELYEENPQYYIELLSKSEYEKLQGIADSLRYMLLSEDEREKFTFDNPYSGFGLPVEVESGVHRGKYALWFAKEIGGNAKLKGEKAGWWTEYSGNAEARGRGAGWFSKYKHYSEASGKLAGGFSIFEDYSEASGRGAGWFSKYKHYSEASGKLAGGFSIFEDYSEASGKWAGGFSIIEGRLRSNWKRGRTDGIQHLRRILKNAKEGGADLLKPLRHLLIKKEK